MGRLTEAQRNQVIGMLRFESISQVAKFFIISKSTISRFIPQNNLIVLPRPSRCPDLNPVEHVWDAMKLQIRQKKPENLVQLAREIINAWTNLRPKNLIKSMQQRVRKCIQQRGGHKGY